MRASSLVCLALVLAGVGVAAPAPAARSEGPPAQLGEINTILAEEPSATRVDVPAGTVFGYTREDRGFRARTTGDFVALILVREGESLAGPTLALSQLKGDPVCEDEPCPFKRPTRWLEWIGLRENEDGLSASIPAGTYRLIIVADRYPVTVTLRLKGPAGQVRLDGLDAITTRYVPLTFEPEGAPRREVSWTSDSHDLGVDVRGLMMMVAWIRMPFVPAGQDVRYCMYRSFQPTDGPGCPGAIVDIGVSGHLVGPLKSWLLLGGFSFPVQGEFAQKIWYDVLGTVDLVGGFAMWVPFGSTREPLPYTAVFLQYVLGPEIYEPPFRVEPRLIRWGSRAPILRVAAR